MNFESYSYCKNIDFTKIEMSFGTYYFCKNFFIEEIHEGVHLDWENIQFIFEKLRSFYGTHSKIAYISNRINHFSVDPNNWTKIEQEYELVIASAIVIYSNSTYMNASIEKLFTQNSIKRCIALKEAIDWVRNLKEFT